MTTIAEALAIAVDVAHDIEYFDTLTIRWDSDDNDPIGGYLRVEYQVRDGGTLFYQGVHHPGEGYCEGNPCAYCGKAFYEDPEFVCHCNGGHTGLCNA